MFESNTTLLFLGQDELPALPGESGSTTTGTVDGGRANGASGTGTTGPPTSNPFSSFLPLMLVAVVLMLGFSMFGQRKEKKKREQMISAVKKHDRVQTVGGVLGSVVEVKPEQVVLKVDESSNTRITFAKSAIQQVLNVSAELSAPEQNDLSK